MNRQPTYLLFDCMDTLLSFDEKEPYWYQMGEIATETGAYKTATEFVEEYGQQREIHQQSDEQQETTLYKFIENLLATRIPEFKLSEELYAQFVSSYVLQYAARTRPEPGVSQMLVAWKDEVQMGVVSNFILKDMPIYLLKRHNLDHFFDFILDSAAIGWRKPCQKIYHHALKLAGIKKNQVHNVCFIGDNWNQDVQMPINLGMQAVYYSSDKSKVFEVPSVNNWSEFRPSKFRT